LAYKADSERWLESILSGYLTTENLLCGGGLLTF
jgi:hypothetical protein